MNTDMNIIYFYNQNIQPYGSFSNYSNHSVIIDNLLYKTTEHYFQSQKFINNPTYMELIRTSSSPSISKKLGSTRTYKIRDDWESVKDDIMLKASRHKFTQHNDLKQLLLSTNDKILVEHTQFDSYWGDGKDGKGLNKLGKCLMIIREELRNS